MLVAVKSIIATFELLILSFIFSLIFQLKYEGALLPCHNSGIVRLRGSSFLEPIVKDRFTSSNPGVLGLLVRLAGTKIMSSLRLV